MEMRVNLRWDEYGILPGPKNTGHPAAVILIA